MGGGGLGKRRRANSGDESPLNGAPPQARRRYAGEDNVIGIDESLRNDLNARKRVSGGIHDDIVDITKEIINRQ